MKLPRKNEIRKPSKTLAGVTPIAVMCKSRKCKHGTCLYCPSLNVPQSYTPKSPPVLRAERLSYDSYEQVISRLKAFKLMNHPVNKIEIIIMGGNFLDYPKNYQYDFVKGIYDALNEFDKRDNKLNYENSDNVNDKKLGRVSKRREIGSIEDLREQLEEAKKLNEKAKHRCVALCLETRPDTCLKRGIIKRMLEFGCTRVELGIQCLDDKIYKLVCRGHKVEDVVKATKLLKNNGFKIGYHLMLGLPGSNPKKDFEMYKELFKNEDFKPDQLKIYPCQVIQGARLVNLYNRGKYYPYSKEDVQDLIIKIMKIIPNYCRVMRIMREIPPEHLVAGILRIDLRRDIEEELKKWNGKIREIRFREVGFAIRDNKKVSNKLKLKITRYKSAGGKEYFLEFVNKDNILFGLLRLRVNKDGNAIVRELHVYGQSLNIGKRGKGFGQHSGLGKKLIKEAEKIVKENGIGMLKIISGVGVREYYKKLGYKLDEESYMVKKIK